VPPALDDDNSRIEAAAGQHLRACADAGTHGAVMRPEPHEPLDFDFEGIDGGGFVERRVDLRKRDYHSQLWPNPRSLGSALDALSVTLLARPAHIGRMLGKRHLLSGSAPPG
jgi:hypothetical protein